MTSAINFGNDLRVAENAHIEWHVFDQNLNGRRRPNKLTLLHVGNEMRCSHRGSLSGCVPVWQMSSMSIRIVHIRSTLCVHARAVAGRGRGEWRGWLGPAAGLLGLCMHLAQDTCDDQAGRGGKIPQGYLQRPRGAGRVFAGVPLVIKGGKTDSVAFENNIVLEVLKTLRAQNNTVNEGP